METANSNKIPSFGSFLAKLSKSEYHLKLTLSSEKASPNKRHETKESQARSRSEPPKTKLNYTYKSESLLSTTSTITTDDENTSDQANDSDIISKQTTIDIEYIIQDLFTYHISPFLEPYERYRLSRVCRYLSKIFTIQNPILKSYILEDCSMNEKYVFEHILKKYFKNQSYKHRCYILDLSNNKYYDSTIHESFYIAYFLLYYQYLPAFFPIPINSFSIFLQPTLKLNFGNNSIKFNGENGSDNNNEKKDKKIDKVDNDNNNNNGVASSSRLAAQGEISNMSEDDESDSLDIGTDSEGFSDSSDNNNDENSNPSKSNGEEDKMRAILEKLGNYNKNNKKKTKNKKNNSKRRFHNNKSWKSKLHLEIEAKYEKLANGENKKRKKSIIEMLCHVMPHKLSFIDFANDDRSILKYKMLNEFGIIFQQNVMITHLFLNNCDLTDNDLLKLIDIILPTMLNLKYLDLSFNKCITDKYISYLFEKCIFCKRSNNNNNKNKTNNNNTCLKGLEYLDLSGLSLGNDTCKTFCQYCEKIATDKEWQTIQLKSINFSNNKAITMEGGDLLNQIYSQKYNPRGPKRDDIHIYLNNCGFQSPNSKWDLALM